VTLEATQKPLKIGGPVNSKYHLRYAVPAHPSIPKWISFEIRLKEISKERLEEK
jgi:hypothetical protein